MKRRSSRSALPADPDARALSAAIRAGMRRDGALPWTASAASVMGCWGRLEVSAPRLLNGEGFSPAGVQKSTEEQRAELEQLELQGNPEQEVSIDAHPD